MKIKVFSLVVGGDLEIGNELVEMFFHLLLKGLSCEKTFVFATFVVLFHVPECRKL